MAKGKKVEHEQSVSKAKQPVSALKKKPGKDLKSAAPNYYIPLVAIVILTIIVYWPSLSNGFVNWDDDEYIQNNISLHSIHLKDIFSSYAMGNYHPITMLVYSIGYNFFGLNAHGYHVMSLLFHLLNTVLVFYAIYFLVNKVTVALVASLLFGIHPLHVESVAWASALKDLLYAFFFLLSYICYLLYLKDSKKEYYVFCLLLFLLSLLSKAVAVSLPVVLLLTDYFKGRKLNAKAWIEKIPFFALSIIFGIVAVFAQKSKSAISNTPLFPLHNRIAFAGYDFITYLFKLIVPFNLSAYYPYPVAQANAAIPVMYYLYVILFIALVAVILFSLRFSRIVVLGVGFFACTVFLVLQLLPVGEAMMADRYTYIPAIGIFYLAGEGWFWLRNRKKTAFNYKTLSIVFILLMTVCFSLQTYARCAVWKNGMALWNDVISKHSTVSSAYNNRGLMLLTDKRNEEAINDFNKAIELRPGFATAHFNRGIAFANENKYEEALKDYSKAIALQPDYSKAYNNRGVVLGNEKKYEEAMQDYRMAIKLNPNDPEAYFNVSAIEYYLGKKDDACRDLLEAANLGHEEAKETYNKFCQ